MENVKTVPVVISAGTVTGNKVRNQDGEHVGKVEEIVLDVKTGQVAYVVMSFGGVLGMGEKFFAVPWSSLMLDTDKHEFVMNVHKDLLKKAPGFDKDHWPKSDSYDWMVEVYDYYDAPRYW